MSPIWGPYDEISAQTFIARVLTFVQQGAKTSRRGRKFCQNIWYTWIQSVLATQPVRKIMGGRPSAHLKSAKIQKSKNLLNEHFFVKIEKTLFDISVLGNIKNMSVMNFRNWFFRSSLIISYDVITAHRPRKRLRQLLLMGWSKGYMQSVIVFVLSWCNRCLHDMTFLDLRVRFGHLSWPKGKISNWLIGGISFYASRPEKDDSVQNFCRPFFFLLQDYLKKLVLPSSH